ncbi:MAG: hypothetical protein H6923_07275 [Alphaproteobacteria bacterium]|nr:hypothetical protein [Alphaproteobacteria bacterium]
MTLVAEDTVGRGLFLSAEGLSRSRQAYERIALGAGREDVAPYIDALLERQWSSFDDLYVSMYALNLLGRHDVRRRVTPARANQVLRYTLKAIMGVELPQTSKDAPFEDTLLDELDVVEVAKFRASVERLIPYPMEVVAFGLGCVWIEMGVYLSSSASRDPEHVPAMLGTRDLSSRAWDHVKRRFGSEIELIPV